MPAPVAQILVSFLNVVLWIIIARVLLSWVIRDPQNPLMRMLSSLTDPLMSPFRKYLTFGSVDLTPIAFYFAIRALMGLIAASVV